MPQIVKVNVVTTPQRVVPVAVQAAARVVVEAVEGAPAGELARHAAAQDPHPVYTTAGELAAALAPVVAAAQNAHDAATIADGKAVEAHNAATIADGKAAVAHNAAADAAHLADDAHDAADIADGKAVAALANAATASGDIADHLADTDPHGLVTLLAAKADLDEIETGVFKLRASQLPALAVVDYLGTVANQTAMLALRGQNGDWCIRSDTGAVHVISTGDGSLVGHWTALSYPGDAVAALQQAVGALETTVGSLGARMTAAESVAGSLGLVVAGKAESSAMATLADYLSAAQDDIADLDWRADSLETAVASKATQLGFMEGAVPTWDADGNLVATDKGAIDLAVFGGPVAPGDPLTVDESGNLVAGTVVASGAHVGTAPPADPADGQLWFDTSVPGLFVWVEAQNFWIQSA